MGIKTGMASLAAIQKSKDLPHGLFVPVKLNNGKPFPFAQVIFDDDRAATLACALRYPYGELGYLRRAPDLQLEILRIEEFQWVPTEAQMQAITGTLDPSKIIFNGTHEVRDIPESELV